MVDTSPHPSPQGEGASIRVKEKIMQKYVCTVCHYEYDPAVGDPDNGVEAGTAFADIPDTWVCPLCSVGKDMFEEV